MTIVYPNEWQEEIEELIDEYNVEDIEGLLLIFLKREVLRIRINSFNQQKDDDHSDSIQGIIEQTEGEAS
jgi:hypothetical protein|tara:strand:- start:1287 stop:1496 length:210 start_codon:yes stop_codon:yes gene_type:complete